VLGFDLLRGREEIRRRTELVGHRTRLYEDLTAEENLRFTCLLHGVSPQSAASALERVGLAGVGRDRVRGFSQGMRQRIALARCLVRSPDLLLLDEPYAGLDEWAKDLVDQVVRGARDQGRTAVLATHDSSRGDVAGRTIFMERGRIVPETK
jgi:ABC-type multidrug transport system ATPase subunit